MQNSFTVITFKLILLSKKSSHRGGLQFLMILDLWGKSFHAVVVFGLGKNLLFKYALGHCEGPILPGFNMLFWDTKAGLILN